MGQSPDVWAGHLSQPAQPIWLRFLTLEILKEIEKEKEKEIERKKTSGNILHRI